MGRLVDIGDTALNVVERGEGPALIALHGGPGLDHHWFGDYLDPLTDRYRLVLVDQRGQGRSGPSDVATWTLAHLAADVSRLAAALGLTRYAVLGHSFGAFVALQHAVDHPREEVATVVSCGVPGARWLHDVQEAIASLEAGELRERVAASWARETAVNTREELAALLHDQLPFHFADPYDERIADYDLRSAETVYAPDVLRHFATQEYGAIDVEDRLGQVTGPTLVLAGRHDRTCAPAASEAMARAIPGAELVIFGRSGHMAFVEEPEAYVAAVRSFLHRHLGG